jgi:hypothetical protein
MIGEEYGKVQAWGAHPNSLVGSDSLHTHGGEEIAALTG